MLHKVEVETEQGVILTLFLDDVSSGYVVQDIQGLDPVKATITSSAFAQMDGEQFQNSRREKRNIIFSLGIEADYVSTSVQELRKRLYTFFMPRSTVLLRFFQDDEPMVQIKGMVETFTSPKFGPEPYANISIICFDPDFIDPTPVVISGNTTSNVFETTHAYDGSVETGFLFKLMVNRNVTDFTIYHRPENDSLRSLEFSTAAPLIAGDVLSISTIPGNKFVYLTRNGIRTSRLYNVPPYSNWINLFPGNNRLRVFTGGAGIPYTIEYTTKYGGL